MIAVSSATTGGASVPIPDGMGAGVLRVDDAVLMAINGLRAKDQQLADMTISLGSIDPCFSCTDRMEVVDIRSGEKQVYTQEELLRLVRQRND